MGGLNVIKCIERCLEGIKDAYMLAIIPKIFEK